MNVEMSEREFRCVARAKKNIDDSINDIMVHSDDGEVATDVCMRMLEFRDKEFNAVLSFGFVPCLGCDEVPMLEAKTENVDGSFRTVWKTYCDCDDKHVYAFSHQDLKLIWNNDNYVEERDAE